MIIYSACKMPVIQFPSHRSNFNSKNLIVFPLRCAPNRFFNLSSLVLFSFTNVCIRVEPRNNYSISHPIFCQPSLIKFNLTIFSFLNSFTVKVRNLHKRSKNLLTLHADIGSESQCNFGKIHVRCVGREYTFHSLRPNNQYAKYFLF